MDVYLIDTKQVVKLSYKDYETKQERIYSLLESYNATEEIVDEEHDYDQKFLWSEELGFYRCSLNLYEFWRDLVTKLSKLDARIANLSEKYGKESVTECIGNVCDENLIHYIIEANSLLDSLVCKNLDM